MTTVVVGPRPLPMAAPSPTPRQQQIHSGTVMTSTHINIVTTQPITIAAMILLASPIHHTNQKKLNNNYTDFIVLIDSPEKSMLLQ